MVTQITQGVRISVETYYQPEFSRPFNNEFMFAYRITIENNGESTIRLIRRHWHITDATGSCRIVEGEGVIGQKPFIEPGDSHQYVSGCHLRTEVGKMNGYFIMKKPVDGKQFQVTIPEFRLETPFKRN